MSTRSARKGAGFEVDVVNYLRDRGHPAACRIRAGATDDRGDIGGVPGWTLECKNHADVAAALRLGVDQAREAAALNGGRFAAVVKRRLKPVGEAYVVMPLAEFVDLLDVDRATGMVGDG